MAYDEAFQVHERLGALGKTIIGNSHLGVFTYAWVIPGIILVLVLALFFLNFLLRIPPTARFRFLLAGALYIGGCIGFEMIGGAYHELHGVNNLTINIISNAEEGLEMTGLIVFVYALLAYIREQYNEVLIRLV